jgi:glucosamine--fructose-6-phosphate aminotransferase (isomerizing)
MCGIVGIASERDVGAALIEGLGALEYRGYDSAGLAVHDGERVARLRARGKVRELFALHRSAPLRGSCGIAHTRWATHGVPSVDNAHPHVSGGVSVVHNGIIENHAVLRLELQARGVVFSSQTDTEVVAHLIELQQRDGHDLLAAVRNAVARLEGSYAVVVLSEREPGRLVAARNGSPLVLGLGTGENYLASDVQALLRWTQRFVPLDDGETAVVTAEGVSIQGRDGAPLAREARQSEQRASAADRGSYEHYMLKEIHEQPQALRDTLEGRTRGGRVLAACMGPQAEALLGQVRAVHIVACGTSLHAGQVARYWIESLAGLPCTAEIASEYRYRDVVVPDGTLYVTITQSGETSDTLAALRLARQRPYAGHLVVCNVPESSAVREADLVLMTRAGPEIGVASTKAFTAQLGALALLSIALAQARGANVERCMQAVRELGELPRLVERALALDAPLRTMAYAFLGVEHALFLGRGAGYPLALEGALKLKEISYIHAEGYAAGELKHGPLALVDGDMPVVAVVPSDGTVEKLLSNLEEVRARGGHLFVFADERLLPQLGDGRVLALPACGEIAAPIVFAIPLQLLAYHVAALRGTDVDQPRNLAKSVTVE